ncbi:MAG: phosphotransferase, partial [Solirubrobacterales bacterium]|nr:phosphotransferase [Solirubrobacterales bacterium]
TTEAEAALLRRLEDAGFPSERCADERPVSTCHGRPVLVTEFIDGPRARSFAWLGALLGHLHMRPGTGLPAGGAWHHVAVGTPADEISAVSDLLDDAVASVRARELALLDRLRGAAELADDCHDLPHCVVHPDFVPANAIQGERSPVIVDWAGAGRGPRLWSLGFLLWAAASQSRLEAVISRYTRRVTLEPEELDRLDGAIWGRPVMLDCWSFATGRVPLPRAAERVEQAQGDARRIAEHARRLFAG